MLKRRRILFCSALNGVPDSCGGAARAPGLLDLVRRSRPVPPPNQGGGSSRARAALTPATIRALRRKARTRGLTVTAPKPCRLAAGEGLADVWWKSSSVCVKAGPDETGKAVSQFEVDDPRGSGPPLHVHHNEDETFYIVEGQVTMFVGDERIDLLCRRLLLRPARHPPRLPRPLRACTHARDDEHLGSEQLFVSLGVLVTSAEPPTRTRSCRPCPRWHACSPATAPRSSARRPRAATCPSEELMTSLERAGGRTRFAPLSTRSAGRPRRARKNLLPPGIRTRWGGSRFLWGLAVLGRHRRLHRLILGLSAPLLIAAVMTFPADVSMTASAAPRSDDHDLNKQTAVDRARETRTRLGQLNLTSSSQGAIG